MAEVKYQHIKNETVGKKFFDIPNIKKQIATQQLTFFWHATLTTVFPPNFSPHGATTRDYAEAYFKTIVHNLRLVIPGVDKIGALKTWAHFYLDDRYW